MRHDWLWGGVLLLVFTCGCQEEDVTQGRGTAPAEQVSAATTTTERTDAQRTQIEIADLLEALNMEMWKARINDDPGAVVHSVKMRIKQEDAEPKELLSIDIPDGEPGTLLVHLQGKIGRKLSIGMVFNGDEGTGKSTTNVIDDPFAEVHVARGNTDANVGRPGTIVLRSAAGPGGEDVTRSETVAIFLHTE